MALDEVVNLLGGDRNVVRPAVRMSLAAASGVVLANARDGFVVKTKAVAHLSSRLNYPTTELMEIIHVRGRTAQRRQQAGTLSEEESDRLYRVARITHKAELVFDSKEKAHDWLKQPNAIFGNVAPLALLGTDAGAEVVTDELNRIDYGDLF